MAVPLHVKEKSKWKTIKLPEDVLNREDFSGLVDIQELTDYELVPFEDNVQDIDADKSCSPSKKRKRKDKHEEQRDPSTNSKDKRRKILNANSAVETEKINAESERDTFSMKQLRNIKNEKFKLLSDLKSTSNFNECNSALLKKSSICNKRLQPWIVTSKAIDFVTEETLEVTNDVPANLSSTKTNSSVKSRKSKAKKKRSIREMKDTLLVEEKSFLNNDTLDNDNRSSKKAKGRRKKKKKPQSQLSNESLPTPYTCNNDTKSVTLDMTEWKSLFVPDEIVKALQDQKFIKPTVIQSQALPSAIRDRKDILGAAETGSGKTLAFGIPLLSRLLDVRKSVGYYKDENSDNDVKQEGSLLKNPPMALILEPTRELAVQVRKHLEAISKYTKIKFANVLGGMSVEKQRRVLGKNPEVIIATPGRLWQLIEEGNEHLCQVDRVLCLVLDEADRLVEKGHYEELTKLLELLNKSPRRAKNRQTFVMSATLTMDISVPKRLLNKGKKLPPEEDKIKSLIEKTCLSGKPSVIDLTPAVKVAQTLTELRVNCKADEKDYFLYYFLCQHPGRTLVFANSKDCLRRLVAVFTLLQCSPLPLHADMHQRQRLKNLDRFSENIKGLLIASDVAARGLDIPHVDHVIHYQVPRTMENYVHRSGRTARASNIGLSVMLVGPEDARNYHKIIHGVRKDEDLPLLPVEMDLMPAVKQRVSLAREVDVKEYRLKKKKVKNNFFIKAAEEMDMIIDDDRLLENLGDHADQTQEKQDLGQMKARLEQVLRGSLAPLRMTKYPTKSGQLVTKRVVDLFTR
ncbi:hypothetical protein RRG08_017989 [Elysia crispata]|uniref:RNA helicase n=1 Tax=Elysia crispata TaxID=231223 RepID=A0AAE1DE14_9GAST|nr:hypothetical protein RRG08_017989 [Elysia crispata]